MATNEKPLAYARGSQTTTSGARKQAVIE